MKRSFKDAGRPVMLCSLAVALFCVMRVSAAADVPALLVPASNDGTLWPGVWNARIEKKSWFGVYCDDTACSVKPAVVRIKRGKVEADCGKQIAASALQYAPAHPLFLVDRKPASDRIAQISRTGGTTVWQGMANNFEWQGHHYNLVLPAAYGNTDAYACTGKGKLPLTVSRDGKLESSWARDICKLEQQTAFDMPTDYAVVWAGDLDGDGALDVLLRLPSGGDILLLSGSKDAEVQFPSAGDLSFPVADACP